MYFGLGKRNSLAILDVPLGLPSDELLAKKSISDQCQSMLHPPVSLVGIPAMKKLAREIVHWPREFGADTSRRCLRQVREYLNSPPDLDGNHPTGGLDRYIAFLREVQAMVNLEFSPAINHFTEAMLIVPNIVAAIRQNNLDLAATCFDALAEIEAAAFDELSHVVLMVGWTAISHSLNGIFALSGMIAPTLLKLIRRQYE